MIRGSAGAGWCMAGTPSGWRWPRPAGCCRIWRRSWAGSPAITPVPSTRATPCTASCTSSQPSRPMTGGGWGCGRWSTRSVKRPTNPTGPCWTGDSARFISNRRTMAEMCGAAPRWGSSGLAYLTGLPAGPPDFSRANVLARARRVATEVGGHLGIAVDAAALLTGRAALLGLNRGGRSSAGGATRLLAASDGWCALTLSRPDDVAALPALLHADGAPADPWRQLQAGAATHPAISVAERASLLDLPAARLGEAAAAAPRVTRSA